MNLYRFSFNSPTRFVDLIGLEPFDKFLTCDAAAKDIMQWMADNPVIDEEGQEWEQAALIFEEFVDGIYKYYSNVPGIGLIPGNSAATAMRLNKDDKPVGCSSDLVSTFADRI